MMTAWRRAVVCGAAALVLTAGTARAGKIDVSPVAAKPAGSALAANWNRSANFIEIFVRSYKDSNGDGIGDLKGLTSQLDYLKGLGITGIWLMPIYPSADHDHGYAVADYRAIDPDYGTMADFETLVAEAHKRGIGIILDYVMNHSADTNPIFVSAAASKSSPYRDWYEFADRMPRGWDRQWKPVDGKDGKKGYYYAVFSPQMPDWNLKNPRVVQYHADNLRFWLNKGVDGFRFDAVTMFVENGPKAFLDQPENKPILKRIRAAIEAYPNRYMICEASETPADYVKSGACANAFAFKTQPLIKKSATSGVLEPGLVEVLSRPETARMPLILGNHDSFAGDRAIADLSGHDERDYHAAAAIAILASSTPFTLYGEEIGMSNNGKYNDPGLRAPMSWTGDLPAAGFSTVKPYRALATNYQTHNVASEEGKFDSLLETYRALYAVRNVHPVLGTGTMTVQSKGGDKALVFTRRDGADKEGGGEAAVMINLADRPEALTVDTGAPNTPFVQSLTRPGDNPPAPVTSDASGRITATVPAKWAAVFVKAGGQ
jgi:maltose alpha-D-glucosyltransferase/alpha-amylase